MAEIMEEIEGGTEVLEAHIGRSGGRINRDADLGNEDPPNASGLRKTVIHQQSTIKKNDEDKGTEKVVPTGAAVQTAKNDILCFRCENKGDFATDCKVVLCIYCSRATHLAKDCHLLKMPKPTAIAYGMCRGELLFYEVPVSDEVCFKYDSGKLGKIIVEGGALSTQELIKELEWFIPGDHHWDIDQVGTNEFRTMFPSKVDLSRAKRIKEVPIDKGTILVFDEWVAAPVDKYALQEAWVRIYGCPYKLRCDYLGLFGVGSLIRKATEIDMEFTRKNNVVWMFVKCTRVEYIPSGTDHQYEGEGYGITFEVEGREEEGNDAEMADADGKPQEEKKESEQPAEKHNGANTEGTSANASQNKNVFRSHYGTFCNPTAKTQEAMQFVVQSWGQRVDDEEDSLPSPLDLSAPPKFSDNLSTAVVTPVAADVLFSSLTRHNVQENGAATACERLSLPRQLVATQDAPATARIQPVSLPRQEVSADERKIENEEFKEKSEKTKQLFSHAHGYVLAGFQLNPKVEVACRLSFLHLNHHTIL